MLNFLHEKGNAERCPEGVGVVRRTFFFSLFTVGISLCCATASLAGEVVVENKCKTPVAGSVRNQLGDAIFQFYLQPGQVARFSGEHQGSQMTMSDLPWTISAMATDHFAAGESATALIRSPEARAVSIACPKELIITVVYIPVAKETPAPPTANATAPVPDAKH